MSEVRDRPQLRQSPVGQDGPATRLSQPELPRRQLLGHALRSAAATAALNMFGSKAFASPKPDGARATTLTVDVHHHMLPDFFFRETNEASNPVGGIAPPAWSRELMLSFLDEAEIDAAVMSISTPGVHVGDDARARSLARRCNELAATLMQYRPDRFGGFACVPLPDVDGALEEMEYALDVLKLDGVVLFSNACGVYLGDARFEPVFSELDRRGAVVFVHPNA